MGGRAVAFPTPISRGGSGMKVLRALGKFLFDFFIGDTPELFVLGVAVLGISSALIHFLQAQTVVLILLPLLVFAGVVGSVLLERRRKRR